MKITVNKERTAMKITLTLERDSDNSDPGEVTFSRIGDYLSISVSGPDRVFAISLADMARVMALLGEADSVGD